MRKSIGVAVALLVAQVGSVAESAPLPNLVLACPEESAIGQPGYDSCHGYTYEIPTNQRIVVTGSFWSNYWIRASDLGGSNTVFVCTLPVEPGTYSSCRDAEGIRRTAFVPKDSVLAGGVVTVSKTGGDYADPITAAENAFAGDTWCVAPAWPAQPCVMQIGEGVFILPETLVIPEGLAVAGAGKGATQLVADNGVSPAVSYLPRDGAPFNPAPNIGNIRITDLTIVNSQPGAGRTLGLSASAPPWAPAVAQLFGVAIHVSGGTENVALTRREFSLDILDSEITAVGQGSTAIVDQGVENGPPNVTIERSHVSAETAWSGGPRRTILRFIDSQVLGAISFMSEVSLLEIVRSGVVGDITAHNDHVSVVIRDTSIKGNVNLNAVLSGADLTVVTNTNVEGNFSAGYTKGPRPPEPMFDGLTVHGEFLFEASTALIRGSYILNSAAAAPALSVREGGVLKLEQTFVQGALAGGPFEASSSVLAGPVSAAGTAAASCTDTYDADYELLDASCQPQVP